MGSNQKTWAIWYRNRLLWDVSTLCSLLRAPWGSHRQSYKICINRSVVRIIGSGNFLTAQHHSSWMVHTFLRSIMHRGFWLISIWAMFGLTSSPMPNTIWTTTSGKFSLYLCSRCSGAEAALRVAISHRKFHLDVNNCWQPCVEHVPQTIRWSWYNLSVVLAEANQPLIFNAGWRKETYESMFEKLYFAPSQRRLFSIFGVQFCTKLQSEKWWHCWWTTQEKLNYFSQEMQRERLNHNERRRNCRIAGSYFSAMPIHWIKSKNISGSLEFGKRVLLTWAAKHSRSQAQTSGV